MKAIIAADENELFKLPFKIKKQVTIKNFKVTIFEQNIIFIHSGIGIVNAAAATQFLIDSFDIKEVWNYGAVGGNQHVEYKDLIYPERIYFHDVTTPWYQRGQTPGEAKYFANHLKDKSVMNNCLASGSSFLNDVKLIEVIKTEINTDIFDMEAAAIAQVCHKNNIPLNIIKCVSDIVGSNHDPREDINLRIKTAGKIALDKLITLI